MIGALVAGSVTFIVLGLITVPLATVILTAVVLVVVAVALIARRLGDAASDERLIQEYRRISREERAALRDIEAIGEAAKARMRRHVDRGVIDSTAREVERW